MAVTVTMTAAASRRRGRAYVAAGALAWSTAGLLQRQLSLDTFTQVAARAAFAALAVGLWLAISERGRVVDAVRSIGAKGLMIAACLAVAAAGFISALNYTSVARVLFIQAIAPVVAALIARVFYGERISPRATVTMAAAIGGVALMLGSPGEGDLVGDGLALMMMCAFSIVIVLARHSRGTSMAPAMLLSQLLLVIVFGPFSDWGSIGGDDVGWLALLGGGQMGLGLLLFTIGARMIPTVEVGLLTLLEVVIGPIWVWLFIAERPGTMTLVGGAIVVAAITIQMLEKPSEEPVVPPP